MHLFIKMNSQDILLLGSSIIFTVILYGTPGPATLSLASVGSSFGFRKSISYLSGILVGLAANILISITGFVILIENNVFVFESMKYAGILYIFYLAYKIAYQNNGSHKKSSFTFYHGFLLNIFNPKAYLAAVLIITQFKSFQIPTTVIFIIVMTIAFCVDVFWILFGAFIGKKIESARTLSIWNKGLALLLIITGISTFLID